MNTNILCRAIYIVPDLLLQYLPNSVSIGIQAPEVER